MKQEYDFSTGVRGKSYRADVHLKLPIYLDDDVEALLEKYASKQRVDVQTIVSEILRRDKELLKAA